MALPTKLKLEVVTPDKRVLSEVVDSVVLPGREGYLGVLPGHAPLLTSLQVGEVQYTIGAETGAIALAWGFAEILPESVTVLADLCERPEEIDVARARAKKDEVERLLRQPPPDFDFERAQESLAKALVRIDVATRGVRAIPGKPELRRAPHVGRMKGEGPES